MKIGHKDFKYKKDALNYYKEILNSYKPSEIVTESDLKDLVELIEIRPDKNEKIGCGIETIQVIEVRYKTKCFELIRKDGSKEVFSYRNCINGKSKPTAKFSKTCRETINEDLRNVKLAYFKKFSSKGQVKCQETGELCKWEELNVDHRQPNTFSVIVDRFIEVFRIDINAVEYIEVMDGVYSFAQKELADKFRNYHKDKANLRLVSKGNNLGRSHQARINRQQKDLTID
ncbi:MAG: DCL family protein [Flavobacteriales bacterium]|nr:DCL family protein [Flavobacteriales bacterium]